MERRKHLVFKRGGGKKGKVFFKEAFITKVLLEKKKSFRNPFEGIRNKKVNGFSEKANGFLITKTKKAKNDQNDQKRGICARNR